MDRLRWIIRTDGAHAIGMGHIYRCVCLAEALPAEGIEPLFAVRLTTEAALDLLDGKRLPYLRLPESMDWQEELSVLSGLRASGILLDLSHRETFARVAGIPAYTEGLKRLFAGVALIDGLKGTALLEHSTPHVDLTVTPYFGAENLSPEGRKGFRHLAGERYMVFHPDFAGARRSGIADKALKVLVTMGGADPFHLTERALRGIGILARDLPGLELRIVLGPSFTEESRQAITALAESLAAKCDLIQSPKSLAEHMLWADAAVSASGLTKYELALTGTPSALLSIDEEHAEANRLFAKAGTCLDMGRHDLVEPEEIARIFGALLADAAQRRALSEKGMALVDAEGAARIADELRRLTSA